MARIGRFFGHGHSILPWIMAATLALWIGPAMAQVVDTTLWSTNGTVSAIVRDGNTIYIGG